MIQSSKNIKIEEKNFLICTCDLTNFISISKKLNSIQLFEFLNSLYFILSENVKINGGTIVKYVGDGAIILSPEDKINIGIISLKKCQKDINQAIKNSGFENKITFGIHYGNIAIGKFHGIDHLDIIGNPVNIAFTINHGKSRGDFVISPQVFRKLNKENRKLFHKFTPPIVYKMG